MKPPGRPAGADVAAISDWVRKIHGPDPVDTYEDGTQACIACHEPHPCIETLLADAYDNVRAERDAIEAELKQFQCEARDEIKAVWANSDALRARAERAEAALREIDSLTSGGITVVGQRAKDDYIRLMANVTTLALAAPTEPEGAA